MDPGECGHERHHTPAERSVRVARPDVDHAASLRRAQGRNIDAMADDATPADGPDDQPNNRARGLFANLPMFGDLAKNPVRAGTARLGRGTPVRTARCIGWHLRGQRRPHGPLGVRSARADRGLHVRDVTGFRTAVDAAQAHDAGCVAQRALEAYRPLFTELAVSLGRPPTVDADTASEAR